MRMVRFGHGQVWQLNLVKRVVIHRPEHIAPCAVQRICGLVFLCEPVLEPVLGGVRIGQGCVVAIVFIVDLPCGYVGIAPVAFGHQCGDAFAFVAVGQVAEIIMPTRAEFARVVRGVHGEHIGVFVDHPARRRRGGRAKNDLQTGGTKHFNRVIEPIPGEGAGHGLHPRPCKFTDAHP